jgi:HPt (histidine-containing phosphotransfer) domain-containing protein
MDAEANVALDTALARLEETVGEREFVAELIGDFLDGLGAQLGDMRTASTAGDRERLRRVAHTLKSNAATFGAVSLALACGELEQLARTGEPAAAGELVARVEDEAARAAPHLAAARDARSA